MVPLLAATPAAATTGSLPTWMVRSTAVNLLDNYLGNGILAENAFDVPSTLETGAPHDWLSQDVQTFTAYGPATAPGSLLYALDNGKVPAGVSYLLYDDEAWSATPLAEQEDPAAYMSLFVDAAHAFGYQAILAPAVDLATAMPCYDAQDADWANYLTDCSIPLLAAASGTDVYEVQAQRFEDDTSPGSGCGCYAWFVDEAARQAAAADPLVEVLAGLASDHSGVVSTPQDLYADTVATEGQVDGYWLNVPSQSGACPTCTPGGAPQVAAAYLWLLGYQGNGSQAISFVPPGGAAVGTSATLAATGGPSGNPVVFSLDPASTAGACSLSGPDGATVVYAAVGSCVIDANEVGDADWNPAPQVTATVAVAPGSQQIGSVSLGGLAAAQQGEAPGGVVGTSATLSAAGGGSTSPVVFSVDPSTPAGVCEVAGAGLELTGVGSCVVDANQAGDANWDPAPQVEQTVTVTQGTQAIAFSPPAVAAYGTSLTLTAAGGASGNPVVFSVDPSSGPGVCQVFGAVLAVTGVGACVVDADQAGDASYGAAVEVVATIDAVPASQSITFGPAPAAAVGTPAMLAATGGGSRNPVVFSVDPSSGAGVCTVSGPDGASVSFAAAGTCVVEARQAGDADWLLAPAATQSFYVGRAQQTITFTSVAPAGARYAGPTYTVAVRGGASGNPVVVTSGRTTVCTVSGTTVRFVGVGTCPLLAQQAGNARYLPAAAKQAFVVHKSPQAFVITSKPPAKPVVGGSYTVATKAGASGMPVVLSSATPSVCTVGGAVVHFVGAGTCTVDANEASDADYYAAPEQRKTFTVAR